jgi:hypothetical protein
MSEDGVKEVGFLHLIYDPAFDTYPEWGAKQLNGIRDDSGLRAG